MDVLGFTFLGQLFSGMPLQSTLAVVALIIISLGAHEAAHAWVALKCGDPTGRDMGRITLNPLPHIDPMMTIVVPLVLVMTTGFLFGGARPVPVNFYNLRRPYRDMALVAIAGPATNFLIAVLIYTVWHVLHVAEVRVDKTLPQILYYAAYFNVVLAAFNLMPIPPLDGSRVMTWLLPKSLRASYAQLEQFGMFIILGLLWFGFLNKPIFATMDAMMSLIRWIVTLGGAW